MTLWLWFAARALFVVDFQQNLSVRKFMTNYLSARSKLLTVVLSDSVFILFVNTLMVSVSVAYIL